MQAQHTNTKSGCQLQVISEATGPLTLFDKIRINRKRLWSALQRRLPLFLRCGTMQFGASCDIVSFRDKGTTEIMTSEGRSLKAGVLVEVITYEEILLTLDSKGKFQGLEFMAGMERYAGRRFTVLKNVRTMFDERAWKMVRIKNTVILKDVICDSHGMYDKEGCDRCCFYFWKERWLRKVEG